MPNTKFRTIKKNYYFIQTPCISHTSNILVPSRLMRKANEIIRQFTIKITFWMLSIQIIKVSLNPLTVFAIERAFEILY